MEFQEVKVEVQEAKVDEEQYKDHMVQIPVLDIINQELQVEWV